MNETAKLQDIPRRISKAIFLTAFCRKEFPPYVDSSGYDQEHHNKGLLRRG